MPKIVVFVRHGSVEEGHGQKNPLSEQGRRDIQRVAREIGREHVPTLICHSSLPRGVESAEIIREYFSSFRVHGTKSRTLACLPDERLNEGREAIASGLAGLSNTHHIVVLVSHEPDISRAIRHITGQHLQKIIDHGEAVIVSSAADTWRGCAFSQNATIEKRIHRPERVTKPPTSRLAAFR